MSAASRLACVLLSFGGAAAAALPAGCEDSAARARDDAQAALVAAAQEYWKAASTGADPAPGELAGARARLERVARDLSAVNGGAPGQQAVAALGQARAAGRMAEMTLAQIRRTESANRAARQIADGIIDAAVRLDIVAGNLEAFDVEAEESELLALRTRLEQEVRDQSRAIADLDGPIAELTSANRRDQTEVGRLREEANTLRRKAAELGPIAGQESYERAVATDRAADRLEYEIGQREIRLEHDLLPRHEKARAAVEHLQARLQTIDEARQALESMVQTSTAEAESTRQEVARYAGDLTTRVQGLEQEMGATLKEWYAQAGSDLERCAAKARSAAAGRSDFADVARIEAAAACQALGALHQSAAEGLSDHLALLRRIESGPEELRGALRGDPAAHAAARDEALRQGAEAYTSARELLDQVNLRGARGDLDALKKGLDEALQALTAKPREVTQPPAARARPASGGAGATAGLGPGAASPEELVAALRGVAEAKSVAQIATVLDYVHVRLDDRMGREGFALARDVLGAGAELDSALLEAFGKGLIDLAGEFEPPADAPGVPPGPIPDFGSFSPAEMRPSSIDLGEVSGDRGEIIVTMQDGSTEPAGIVQVNGRWFIASAEEEASPGGPSPEEVGKVMAMLQMFKPVIEQGLDLCRRLAQRTRGGEFAALEDFKQAFASEFQTIVQEAMSGMGLPFPMPGAPPASPPPGR